MKGEMEFLWKEEELSSAMLRPSSQRSLCLTFLDAAQMFSWKLNTKSLQKQTTGTKSRGYPSLTQQIPQNMIKFFPTGQQRWGQQGGEAALSLKSLSLLMFYKDRAIMLAERYKGTSQHSRAGLEGMRQKCTGGRAVTKINPKCNPRTHSEHIQRALLNPARQ